MADIAGGTEVYQPCAVLDAFPLWGGPSGNSSLCHHDMATAAFLAAHGSVRHEGVVDLNDPITPLTFELRLYNLLVHKLPEYPITTSG
jgi:hypothetical protein